MATERHTIHMIGHGHIDPTWLWRWTEGYEEVRATFRSALDRMKETPGFTFTASSACFYAWVEVCDPEMFQEIRQRIREGRWEIAGGWWVEPDCNLPGGESFVRHGLYSQRFFQDAFGVRVRVGFNPDSFGHAGTLPQLLTKMGIDYYVFARPAPIHEMDYPEGTTFWWRANDGSQVLAALIPEGYGCHAAHVLDRIKRLPKHAYLNPGQTHILGFYGVGNHGGGPTKEAIAAILQAQQDGSLPKVVFSTLSQYFEAFLRSTDTQSIPVVPRDLQHHARGCYSVHSEVKRLNRKTEHALMGAERFATIAWLLHGHRYPKAELEQAWKLLLYNQFHDILAGTSIEAAYEDTRDQLGAARNTATAIGNESIQVLARHIDTKAPGNTIVVLNPLPWPVKQTVKAASIVARGLTPPLQIVDDAGKPVACQPVRGQRIGHTDYLFTAEVPGLGYRCYHARSQAKRAGDRRVNQRALEADRRSMENAWWHIEFDPYAGHMTRLRDKRAGVETLQKGNVLACLVDQSDTWGHGYNEWRVEAGRFGDAVLDVYEMGNVCATVRIVSHYNKSVAEQFVTLYRDSDAIDCLFRINWQERYTMLKLVYETPILGGTATCEAPYGCQVRNIDGWEEPCQKWVDLTGTIRAKAYGFALLNDSKYGFDVRGGTLRLTLLRSPAYAYHDRARHDSSEAWPIMDQGWHAVRVRLAPHPGSWERAGVVKKAWELNEPAFTHIESAHKGALPAQASFLSADAPNVLLTVLKQAEDGNDLILRGYETAGKKTKTAIHSHYLGKSFPTTFHRHEIKTLRVNPNTWTANEVNLLEE